MKPFLSVCMIVKNEEKVLRRCLESIIGIADEIIIADTGSNDRTREISFEFTENVFDYKWEDDFSKARNFAASKASGEWILVIDADEYLDRESFMVFKNDFKANPPKENILAVQIINFVGDNGKDTLLNYHERLYKNDGTISYYRSIHELLIHKDSSEIRGFASLQLYHSGYMKSVINEKEKSKRNLTLLKNKKVKEPIDYYFIGNEYDQIGDLDNAIKYYKKGFKLKDNIHRDWVKKLLLRLVHSLHKAKRNNEALEILEFCDKIFVNIVDYKFYKGLIFFDIKEFNKAKIVFEGIVSKKDQLIADSSVDYLELLPNKFLGQIYENENHLTKAVHHYTSALSINGEDEFIWIRLINLLANNSTLEELSGFLNNNLLNRKNMTPLRVIRLLLSVPNLDVQKLTRSFHDEIELSKKEIEALLVKNYFLDNDFCEVLKVLNKKSTNEIFSVITTGIFSFIDFIILSIETQNKDLLSFLDEVKFNTQNISNLINMLFNNKKKRLRALEEEVFISILRQAKILECEKVIGLLTSNYSYISTESRFKIEEMEKDIFKARDKFSGSIGRDYLSNTSDIIYIKEYLKLLVSEQRYHDALTIIEESLHKYSSDVDLYCIKAVTLINLQKIDEAIKTLKEGLKLDPNHVDSIYNLGYICEQNNNLIAALNHYKKLIILTSESELLEEVNLRINYIQQLLSQEELNKRVENNKYAKKQNLFLKKSYNVNQNMHVVYVLTHVGICGGVKIILEHANRLTKMGITVTLVCHYPKPTWYKVEANYIEVPFGTDLENGIPECDVIVATYWNHIQACIDTEIAPVVYFEQGDFHLFDLEKIDKRLKEFIYQQYQLPTFILTVSKQAANFIKKIYHRDALVIPNAIDTSIFNNKSKSEDISSPYILMMGDMNVKFKGLNHIIDAYNLLKDTNPNIQLIWITPSPPANEYIKLVDEYFVNPTQRQIADLFSNATLFVSASYYESFSLPVLEAMACGCPVVTTANHGVLEYARDDYNVLTVKTGDSFDIYKKILKIINNSEIKDNLVKNAEKTVDNFKWDNIISQLFSFYKEVMSYEIQKTNN